MKRSKFIALLLLGVSMLQVTAWAEMISGVIASVDKANNSMRINRPNPATGGQEKLTISVPEDTKFKGANSLEDLQEGVQVQVEAKKAETGDYEADSIALKK